MEEYFSERAAMAELGLRSKVELRSLERAGLISPVANGKGRTISYSKSDVLRAKSVLLNRGPEAYHILLDVLSRLDKVESALTVMANIIKPSISDSLFGVSAQQLADITINGLADTTGKMAAPKILELLKIAANITISHADDLRPLLRTPRPIMLWVKIVSNIASMMKAHQNQYLEDPQFYKLLQTTLKAAQSNLTSQALLELGPEEGLGLFREHPRRVVARILKAKKKSDHSVSMAQTSASMSASP